MAKDNASWWWWELIRIAALQLAAVPKDTIDTRLRSEHSVPRVITYISRQGGRRGIPSLGSWACEETGMGVQPHQGSGDRERAAVSTDSGHYGMSFLHRQWVQVGLNPKAGPR